MPRIKLEAGQSYTTEKGEAAHVVAITQPTAEQYRYPNTLMALGFIADVNKGVRPAMWDIHGTWWGVPMSPSDTINPTPPHPGKALLANITHSGERKAVIAIAHIGSSTQYTKAIREIVPITCDSDEKAKQLIEYIIKENIDA